MSNKNFNVVFILPVPSQPRFNKRIKIFKDIGIEGKIFSFEREYFKGNTNLYYESLGEVSHKKYFNRIMPLIRAIKKVKGVLSYNSILYSFSLDTAMIAVAIKVLSFKNIKIIYECGDIRSVLLGQKLKNSFFRLIERFIIKQSYIVVTTSPAYIEDYFLKIQKQNKSKLFLLENKIKEPVPKPINKKIWNGNRPLVIGYFGLLRCKRTLDILFTLAKDYPEHFFIYIRGFNFGLDNLGKLSNTEENIDFQGEYVYPDDLAEIYGKVDIVWGAYPFEGTDIGNWQWAMTNRFYESLYYKTPIITQQGTQDARRVIEHQVGLAVNMNDIKGTIDQIRKINPQEYNEWINNIETLPKSIYVHSGEHKLLIKKLLEL